MKQDEIIEMARQAGIDHHKLWNDDGTNRLEAFAKLVRNDYSNKHAQLWLKRIDEAVKAEREACAKVCDELEYDYWRSQEEQEFTPVDCAQAIRARGEA